MTLEEAFAGTSAAQFDRREQELIDSAALARTLYHAAGVVRVLPAVDGSADRWFRPAGSAHNLSPLELYLVTGAIDQLPAGTYHYDPLDHALSLVRPGDYRAHMAASLAERRSYIAYVILTGVPWRTVWRDGLRGFRNLYLDGGAMLANLMASAAAVTRASLHVGFVDHEVSQLLGLEADSEFPLAVVGLGGPGESRRSGPAPPPLEPVAPGSLGPHTPCPPIAAAQTAGNLTNRADLRRWRRVASAAGEAPQMPLPSDVESGTRSAFDEVVLLRSSTRRFSAVEIDRRALDSAVPTALAPVAWDASRPGHTLLTHSVVVHAIAGLAPGRYSLDRGRLRREAAGDFRATCLSLSMGQRLAADAALVIYHQAAVRATAAIMGDRGYRAALLEAGMASARLQLAAFGLGLGATALVCYEDEVRRFLGGTGDPVLITALGVPAHRARPGGTPLRPSQLRRIPAPLREPT